MYVSSPRHFEQAQSLVTEDATRESIACGNDVDRHVAAFKPYADAGFDAIHVTQIGGAEQPTNYAGFFHFYRDEVLPRLRDL